MAAFGDMGNSESDGSYHHSWDFGDKGEVPSSNTTTLIEADKEIDMVLHTVCCADRVCAAPRKKPWLLYTHDRPNA